MRTGNNNLVLLYSGPEGREVIADITVSKRSIRVVAYGYNQQQVADLVPQVTNDTPFWENSELYKRGLVQTCGTEGLPFDQGTVYFRWATAGIKPTKPFRGVVTKYPPQEMPENWSTLIPTKGRRRYYGHEI